MNTSATELDFDSNMMWVTLLDGRKLGVPLAYFPRLLAATPEQRQHFELSGNGTGIHWDELDEDISVENVLLGHPSGESQRSFKKWLEARQTGNP